MIEPRADVEVARLIRLRVPDWDETEPEPYLWRFTDPDEDWSGRYVEVDGRDQQVLTVDQLAGTRMGPTVIGYARGMCVRAVIPHVSDHDDRMRAIDAAAAVGALPDENGMTQ